jgi:glycosyltransferase involved in cell wall biosynthesis
MANSTDASPALSCLIIMPAWNEEEVIGSTIRELLSTMPGYDLLVVDDGSTDSTARTARAVGADVLQLPYNMGVGGAMRAGYKYAARLGYDRTIQVDADGQHDPRDIERVLQGLEHADISIGARFAERGSYKASGPRKWAMNLLAFMFSRVAGTRLTDVTSGFRAGNRRAIAQYCRYFPAEYLGDTIDSLAMALRAGLTVTQVPVEMRARQAGTPSNNPAKAAIYLVRSIFSFLLSMTRRRVTLTEEPGGRE